MRGRYWLLVVSLAVTGCGSSTPPPGDDAGPLVCTESANCDDGSFCNGAEVCAPAVGGEARACVAGTPPCADDVCDESADRCAVTCEDNADADGDGADSVACGGNDCDDDNSNRFPGAPEVCDIADLDEDCDPSTFGVRDADTDGYPDERCCNGSTCGGDCDDTRSGIHPSATEACNGDDDDCDGMVDENVLHEYYPDTDGDGYGDASAAPVEGCNPPLDHVENALDCDDDLRTVNPATSELCDGIDNNCNDATDEAGARTFYRDRDEDGFGDPADIVSILECEAPTGYVAIGTDCNDADDAQHPGATEVCNRRDDDCSQPGINRGGVDPSEDADQDGRAPVDGGCTGDLPRDDCDDTRAATYLGALEICNDIDDDCDETRDEGTDAFCGGQSVCEVGVCIAGDRLAVSDGVSCLRTGGVVDCWSASGRIRGDGAPSTPRASLGRVSGLTDARHIATRADDNDIDDDASSTMTRFACAVRASGRVMCWGVKDAAVGGLGDGSSTSSTTPVEVAGLTDAVDVALGGSFACARRQGGGVSCWGDNDYGQLGDGTTTVRATPVAVVGITSAVELTVGSSHACVRLRDGTARCWGSNYYGQLADGGATGAFDPNATPRPVVVSSPTPLTGIDRIVAGSDFTCVLVDGTVSCAGDGDTVGSATSSSSLRPAADIPTDMAWIEGSQSFGLCGATVTGTTYCWGFLSYRQWLCGHPEVDTSSNDPCSVAPTQQLGSFDELSMGSEVACVREGSALRCWGANNRTDRFGNGGTSLASPVRGLSGVQAHHVGCATDGTGDFHHWSHTARGGGATSAATALPAFDGATACVVGRSDVYAVIAGGVRRLPLTYGAPGPIETLPLTGSTVSELIHTDIEVWALLADGSVRSWFSGAANTAVPLLGVTGATDLAVTDFSACVVLDDALWCTGYGELAGVDLDSDVVLEITGAGAVRRVATFLLHSPSEGSLICVVRVDGSVACGSQGNTGSSSFAGVPGIANAVDVAVGRAVGCALIDDGRVQCWGEDLNGALGQPLRSSSAPVVVEGLTDATSLRVSGSATFCARSTSRGLVCWGSDYAGQLGRGVAQPVTLFD